MPLEPDKLIDAEVLSTGFAGPLLSAAQLRR
jgi:hypothetical protein